MILFWIATSGFALLATDEQMLLESTLFAEPRIACCHLRLAFYPCSPSWRLQLEFCRQSGEPIFKLTQLNNRTIARGFLFEKRAARALDRCAMKYSRATYLRPLGRR